MTRRDAGVLRVIGGQWRSRRIAFNAADGVRATPDRVRQTTFDWLAPTIEGAQCLDLFAGSGAMGIEALSRGAAQCTFVDRGATQCAHIQQALTTLGAQQPSVLQHDALQFLAHTEQRFHVVFVDPPFASEVLAAVLTALPRVLRPDHHVYIERAQPLTWPSGWQVLRQKRAGQVHFGLARYALTDA